MDFKLTKAQQMTRQAMREFVRQEVVPLAQELDEKAEFPLAPEFTPVRALRGGRPMVAHSVRRARSLSRMARAAEQALWAWSFCSKGAPKMAIISSPTYSLSVP